MSIINRVTADVVIAAAASPTKTRVFPQSYGFKLRRLQLAYKRTYMNLAGPDCLPSNQIGALSLIHRNQGITPGELAAMLDIDAAHLTAITKQLEASALIRREKSATDSRSHSLFTTAQGALEFKRVQETTEMAEDLFIESVLQPDEISQLSALLDRLLVASRKRDRSTAA